MPQNYNNLLTGLRVQTQIPLDVKQYIQNELLLSNLGVSNNLAFTYTKGLIIYCIDEGTRWEWKPSLGSGGLLSTDYIYPSNIITFGINYSNQAYNFYEIINTSQVNSDWNATSGIQQILNKPTEFVPTSHTHNISDISGTKLEFNTSLTDGNFLFNGDIIPFDPLDYDLDDFTNVSADPFARTSELTSGITNLSYTPSTANGIVNSDTGTDATIPTVDFTNAGLLTPKEKQILYNNSSTGITKFEGFSINIDTAKYNTGIIEGWFVDNTTNPNAPTKVFKSFPATTGNTLPNIATQNVTYVAVDINGIHQQSGIPFESELQRDWIPLGVIVHSNRTSINAINNQPVVLISPLNQLSDLMESIGFFNISGNVFTPNGVNLSINKSSGHVFKQGSNFINDNKDPHTLALTSLIAPSNLRYRTQIGTEFANTNVIDTGFYDLAGVRTAIPGTRWSIQRIYLFQSNLVRIQYGQATYTTQAEAIQAITAEAFVVEQNILENGLFRGLLIVREGATDLTDTSRALFIEASKFGSVAGLGSLSTTNLQQAYDNSITPEITTDSTLGAFTLKRGSALDTDNIFEGQNGAGVNTSSITGNGALTVLTYNGFNPTTDLRNINTTSPLLGGGNLTADRTLSIQQATTSQSGFLTSTDWNIFNSKQSAIGYTTENIANKNVANGYAGLGSDGKLISSQLPSITISDTYVVASEVAMLGLTLAEKGDVAVRTDLNKSFILKGNSYSTLADWQELLTPTSAVTTVFGRNGAVTAQTGDYTATMVGAPSGSGTSTGTNTGDQTNITGNAGSATNWGSRTADFDSTVGSVLRLVGTDNSTGQVRQVNLSSAQSWLGLGSNAYNSTAFAPLNGTGANGTWGINISGNSATATNSIKWKGRELSSATLDTGYGAEVEGIYVNLVNNALNTYPMSKNGIKEALGLGSNAYSSTTYQPLLTNPITGLGTTGYLPKFTSAGVLGNSQVFENGTSVGIGTITPGNSPNNTLLGFLNGSNIQARTVVPQLALSSNIDGDWFAPTYKSNGYAAQIVIDPENMGGGANGIGFNMAPSGTAGTSIPFTRAMTIINGGNVGIGTNTPSAKVQITATNTPGVVPTLKINNLNSSNGSGASILLGSSETENNGNARIIGTAFAGNDYRSQLQLQTTTTAGVWNYGLFINEIGAATFGSSVTATNMSIDTNIYSPFLSSTVGLGVYRGNSFVIRNGIEGSESLNFDIFNRTSSAWTTPLSLANSGAATFSSSVTASGFFNSSDRRLKTILKRDGDVAYFKWKDGRDSKIHIGYIAQEVRKNNPDQVQKGEDKMLSVNYVEILVEKIRMLEKRVKQLEYGLE